METKTLLLNKKQIEKRINRLAYQIYEDNFEEKEIVLAGIASSGFLVAQKIEKALKKISTLPVKLIEIKMDKHNQLKREVTIDGGEEQLKDKVIILVDDVLNSGKTLIYALRPFLKIDTKKIRTVVLVDRNHKRYPIAADFAGLSLATTMQEHIFVELGGDKEVVYLN
jgi:pyrimidine operon attenuation protein / uracil phosphoribosyltransferase